MAVLGRSWAPVPALALLLAAWLAAGERVEDDSVEALTLNAKAGPAAASALGHRAGDVLFGKFRLVEYRGTSPIAEGVPALYPGHWPRAGRRVPSGAALLEGGQAGGRGLGSYIPWPDNGVPNFKPVAGEGLHGDGFRGRGSFGEAWVVEPAGQVPTNVLGDTTVPQKSVLKLLYRVTDDERQVHLAQKDIEDGNCKSRGVTCFDIFLMAWRECFMAQKIQTKVDNVDGINAYKDKFMKCFSMSGPKVSPETGLTFDENQTDDIIWLHLEDCGNEELEDKLVKVGSVDGKALEERRTDWLTAPKVALLIREMAKGLRYLEKVHFLHRDLKPENVMVKDNKDGGFDLKFIDFGFMVLRKKKDVRAGSRPFMPPEQQKSYVFDKTYPATAFDMFSFQGIIMRMLTWSTFAEFENFDLGWDLTDGDRTFTNKVWLADLETALTNMSANVTTSGEPVYKVLHDVWGDKDFRSPRLKWTFDGAREDKDVLTDSGSGKWPKDFMHWLFLKMASQTPESRPKPAQILKNEWVLQGSGVDAPVHKVLQAKALVSS